jgi:hypothetical protein
MRSFFSPAATRNSWSDGGAFVAGPAGVVGPGEQAKQARAIKQTSATTFRIAFMPLRASGAGSE